MKMHAAVHNCLWIRLAVLLADMTFTDIQTHDCHTRSNSIWRVHDMMP